MPSGAHGAIFLASMHRLNTSMPEGRPRMTTTATISQRPGSAAAALHGKIVIPEHARFDEARTAWNLAVDQRPTAVIPPSIGR